MTRRAQRLSAKGAIDLLEEGVELLRSAPFELLAFYCIGSFPFILAFLYFWADMSASPVAYQHIGSAALGLAILYVWMKCWHSIFASGIHAILSSQPAPPVTIRRLYRLFVSQTIFQPSCFLMLPLSVIAVLPFAAVYAFYHNVSLISDNGRNFTKIFVTSWRLAKLWPIQNSILILILSLLALVSFLNIATAILLIPELLRMLFGIETAFTLSAASLLNTTFLAVTCALTYLCLNPLSKAVYVLRCFYGQSIGTGADLKAELNGLSPVAQLHNF